METQQTELEFITRISSVIAEFEIIEKTREKAFEEFKAKIEAKIRSMMIDEILKDL